VTGSGEREDDLVREMPNVDAIVNGRIYHSRYIYTHILTDR